MQTQYLWAAAGHLGYSFHAIPRKAIAKSFNRALKICVNKMILVQ